MVGSDGRRLAVRLNLVHEHVQFENRHDIDGIMETFGNTACYHDEPWDDHRIGRQAVQSYYQQLMNAVPDVHIEVKAEHVANDAIILEVHINGTHTGSWRGLPGTGRKLTFPLCAIYTFDEVDRIAAERIYYDRTTVLTQLGLMHDPASLVGRAVGSLTHPLTIARAACRHLAERASRMLRKP